MPSATPSTLTTRTMWHTCITLNDDAGVARKLIRAITGHELDTIDEVLKCYAAVTADQAAAAIFACSMRRPVAESDFVACPQTCNKTLYTLYVLAVNSVHRVAKRWPPASNRL